MKSSRRNFIKTSTSLGVGGVLSGFLTASCGRRDADNKSVYYDREIITICKADKDLPRHSEASIVELNDSSLLIAWQRFEGSRFGSGDEAPSTIALMNSSDGGRTWGNFRIAVERDEDCVNVYSPNFLRLQNGEILLGYMKYNQLTPGMPQLATAYMIRSQDEGKTFGAPETIWQKDRLTISNSCIKRLSSGRVVMPSTPKRSVEPWRKTPTAPSRMAQFSCFTGNGFPGNSISLAPLSKHSHSTWGNAPRRRSSNGGIARISVW